MLASLEVVFSVRQSCDLYMAQIKRLTLLCLSPLLIFRKMTEPAVLLVNGASSPEISWLLLNQ